MDDPIQGRMPGRANGPKTPQSLRPNAMAACASSPLASAIPCQSPRDRTFLAKPPSVAAYQGAARSFRYRPSVPFRCRKSGPIRTNLSSNRLQARTRVRTVIAVRCGPGDGRDNPFRAVSFDSYVSCGGGLIRNEVDSVKTTYGMAACGFEA